MDVSFSQQANVTQRSNMSNNALKQQNMVFRGTGGISQENCTVGFIPAFLDDESGEIYLSRYTNGYLAAMHVFDSLPDELVLERDSRGMIIAVKASVIAGFCYRGQFYTREQASQVVTKI